MLIGGVLTGLLVLGLFFTMLSSSPRGDEPIPRSVTCDHKHDES
jgi:hypothetical protein